MNSQALVITLARAARAFADELEASLGSVEQTSDPLVSSISAITPATTTEGVSYDPGAQPAPYAADPDGDSRAAAMSQVVFFGKLYAINRRKSRGASLAERRDIAKEAGYSDARAWNNWVPGSLHRDADDAMWLGAKGHRWMCEQADSIDVELPADLTTWVDPPNRA